MNSYKDLPSIVGELVNAKIEKQGISKTGNKWTKLKVTIDTTEYSSFSEALLNHIGETGEWKYEDKEFNGKTDRHIVYFEPKNWGKKPTYRNPSKELPQALTPVGQGDLFREVQSNGKKLDEILSILKGDNTPEHF